MVIAWDFGGLEECVRRYFGLSIVALCLFSEGQHLDTATADFDQSGPEAGVLCGIVTLRLWTHLNQPSEESNSFFLDIFCGEG